MINVAVLQNLGAEKLKESVYSNKGTCSIDVTPLADELRNAGIDASVRGHSALKGSGGQIIPCKSVDIVLTDSMNLLMDFCDGRVLARFLIKSGSDTYHLQLANQVCNPHLSDKEKQHSSYARAVFNMLLNGNSQFVQMIMSGQLGTPTDSLSKIQRYLSSNYAGYDGLVEKLSSIGFKSGVGRMQTASQSAELCQEYINLFEAGDSEHRDYFHVYTDESGVSYTSVMHKSYTLKLTLGKLVATNYVLLCEKGLLGEIVITKYKDNSSKECMYYDFTTTGSKDLQSAESILQKGDSIIKQIANASNVELVERARGSLKGKVNLSSYLETLKTNPNSDSVSSDITTVCKQYGFKTERCFGFRASRSEDAEMLSFANEFGHKAYDGVFKGSECSRTKVIAGKKFGKNVKLVCRSDVFLVKNNSDGMHLLSVVLLMYKDVRYESIPFDFNVPIGADANAIKAKADEIYEKSVEIGHTVVDKLYNTVN